MKIKDTHQIDPVTVWKHRGEDIESVYDDYLANHVCTHCLDDDGPDAVARASEDPENFEEFLEYTCDEYITESRLQEWDTMERMKDFVLTRVYSDGKDVLYAVDEKDAS